MARKKTRTIIEIDPLKISEELLTKKATDNSSLKEFEKALKTHGKLSKILKKK